MRNISFSLTTPQIKDRSKTVTRRLNWRRLKAGDRLQGCVKCMGLKPGEKLEKLAIIEVVNVRREPLNQITQEDCAREGFPDLTPSQFVDMFCKHMGVFETTEITRIEFKYVGVVTKKFGVDFHSSGGALTLSVGCVSNLSPSSGKHTRTHPDGWTITGDVHEDYYTWVNDFEASHPVYGNVWGNFEHEVHADSEQGYADFYKNHTPEAWDYQDI